MANSGQAQASGPRTLYEKIFDDHVIVRRPDGQSLLRIDRLLVHEGAFHGFDKLRLAGRSVKRPDLVFAFADHYVPTRAGPITDPEVINMVEMLRQNCREHGITLFDRGDHDEGIVHVVAPEQGLTLPGQLLVCGDSHTSTHGALGALAFGIGASEVEHALATQTVWQRRARTLRIDVGGKLSKGVTGKDVILAIIGKIGANGASGHVMEYTGSAIRGLTLEGRLTLCNMSIEAGGRAGLVAPDDATFQWLKGRTYAPKGELWERAVAHWRTLPSDEGAHYDREVSLDGSAIEPTITWGTSPETALPVSGRLPDPNSAGSAEAGKSISQMLDYMGLTPGMPVSEITIDRVFIGSCTNSRIEDLRMAASVLKGRKVAVPTMIVAGSTEIRRQAEAEGLDRLFAAAGCDWRPNPGCSMCVGMNGDLVPAGERCASTSNRNFKGRQGPGSRTHLMSPAMAAAAGLTGRITDVRPMLDA
ncbi:MAG: 3-isopropylmalate dehydratase large subunit [Hyphomicrobiaceae bacterium]|nr:3-isopropylmalate dehydratase large subunit [Hyphomicrobiaceae bacterium]